MNGDKLMPKLINSYSRGATDTPLIEQTIGAFFDETVARLSSREALVSRHQNIRYTYLELQREVDRMASALIRFGLEPGDRVGIWSHNNAEWLITQLATAKVGVILVNINPAYRVAELEYALNKVGCKALITMSSFKTTNYLEMVRSLVPEIDSAALGSLESAKVPTLKGSTEFMA